MTQTYRRQDFIDIYDVARRGEVSRYWRAADRAQGRLLRLEAGKIIYPVVFLGLTQRLEIKRGHFHCAAGIDHLDQECLNGFHDDAEAAVSDFLRNAKVPIHNIEGWVRTRLNASTVSAYRRRRGARGALQRPRLAQWLIDALHDDRWLKQLALELLEWVGVARTAGVGIWPLSTWADLRAGITGEQGCPEQTVAADVETVLAAMRRKPEWYALYVERPLERKEAPVLPGQRTPDPSREPTPLVLVEDHEIDDARLLSRAAEAVSRLTARLEQDVPGTTVIEVLRAVFCSDTGAEDLGRPPGTGPTIDEQLDALLADPAVVERIVATVRDIVGPSRT